MLRVAGFGLAFLLVACTAGDERAPPLEGDPSETPPRGDYAVMYKGEIDDATRRVLKAALDRFRASQGHYFLGEVYRLDPPDQYLLVFTLKPQDDEGPYWTDISETAEGVFAVLETADVDGDGSADVVYCRWDGSEPLVEAALRRGASWEVRALPARNDCTG